MKRSLKKLIRDKIWLSIGLLSLVLVTSIVMTSYFMKAGREKDPLEDLNPIAQGTTQESSEEMSKNGSVPDNSNIAINETKPAPTKDDPLPTQPSTDKPDVPVVSDQVKDLDIEFTAKDTIGWPVTGNVLQMFSMDTTVWFPTLKQYKVSRGIEIQSAVNTVVACVANSKVVEVGHDEERGNYVVMDMGNGYRAIYGQLKDIEVAVGAQVASGRIIAKISEPTKYFTLDGPHLYFEMDLNDKPIDPLDFIR